MEIFNIGPLEFILILVLALVVLGPKNMVKTAYEIGRFINKMIRSPMWATLMNTSREIRELPTKIVRESGLEESVKQIQTETRSLTSDLTQQINQSTQSINASLREIRSAATVSASVNSIAEVQTFVNPDVVSSQVTEQVQSPEGAESDGLPDPVSEPMEMLIEPTRFDAAGLPKHRRVISAWEAAGLGFKAPILTGDLSSNGLPDLKSGDENYTSLPESAAAFEEPLSTAKIAAGEGTADAVPSFGPTDDGQNP